MCDGLRKKGDRIDFRHGDNSIEMGTSLLPKTSFLLLNIKKEKEKRMCSYLAPHLMYTLWAFKFYRAILLQQELPNQY